MSSRAWRLAARTVVGALAGAAPGGILVWSTVPAAGEAELLLGVGGLGLTIVGTVTGMALAVDRSTDARE